jgi:hypothetical protein
MKVITDGDLPGIPNLDDTGIVPVSVDIVKIHPEVPLEPI